MVSTTSILPIDAILPTLRASLKSQPRCLLVAQPGAGKTTRVPLALLEDTPNDQRWLLLEPRRVAARLAAGFMAEQLGERVGQRIGYRVRGDSQVSQHTRLEVVTQGILTRILQDDPALDGIAGLIFDEFHERSLDADLGLALALDVQQSLRPDLKLLVMSATLDTTGLLRILGENTPLIDCPGQSWPVTTLYRPAPPNTGRYDSAEIHQAMVIRETLAAHDGDVLVFLPGQGEIRRLQRRLADTLTDADICPLHGQMPLAEQQRVLRGAQPGLRRVILATAIAESSVTVPGVRIVVDAGRERVPVFQPRSGLTRLDTRTVNRASADQRRGRAGREGPGYCYRLWSQEQVLTPHRDAEILQTDLSSLVFELARWGVPDADALSWMTPPPPAALNSCRQMLTTLGLLDNNRLTVLGQRCAEWPTHPRFALLLETARQQASLAATACWLTAWLEERPGDSDLDLAQCLLKRPQQHAHGAAGRWLQAAQQWARRLRCDLNDADPEAAPALLARIFPERIAQNQGEGRFKLASGGQATLRENQGLHNQPLLVAVELDGQATAARIFHAIAISKATLEHALPAAAIWHDVVYWDDKAGRLIAEQQQCLGDLVLARRQTHAAEKNLSPDIVSQALIDALRRTGKLPRTDEDEQFLGRLRLLHKTLGEPWPDVTDDALLATLETWLRPHLTGIRRLDQIQRLPLARLLLQSLDWSLQNQIDQLTPTHLKVPSGSNIKLDYSGDEPVLAVKLQEMFGQTHTPTVIGGKVPLLIHLLSPARRPVQVTRDLAGFWAGSYFDVRKDLRGRYPKHPWPDDPLQAPATRFTKKR
ncbi:MAG: ATP-dependent helicase HrpB [Pseudohongiella sp.]|uniref:ATP-dependent helicase HrpB n=1 Tax=Pseudohongiella sp. TaxID=1979412 RepID=UPI00349FD3E9